MLWRWALAPLGGWDGVWRGSWWEAWCSVAATPCIRGGVGVVPQVQQCLYPTPSPPRKPGLQGCPDPLGRSTTKTVSLGKSPSSHPLVWELAVALAVAVAVTVLPRAAVEGEGVVSGKDLRVQPIGPLVLPFNPYPLDGLLWWITAWGEWCMSTPPRGKGRWKGLVVTRSSLAGHS